jgi:hypothetical protein
LPPITGCFAPELSKRHVTRTTLPAAARIGFFSV